MIKSIIISIGLIVSSLANAQTENNNLNNGCDYKQDSLRKIQVKITEKYSDQFSSHDDAMDHCMRISQTKAATKIDQQKLQCSAHKDDTGHISTTMSGEFMDQYNSYEEAQENCWKLHGYEDTVESQNKDMIVVESSTSTDSSTGYPMTSKTLVHKDDVQQYYIDKQEEEIERQNQKLKINTQPTANYGCTLSVEPALRINVFDAVTNENIACKVKAIVNDNNYQAELDNINCSSGFLEGPRERSGNYSINISAKGYQSMQKNEIIVSSNDCHVITEELYVNLQPTG